MIRVLFVCLGNICRSPLAEAIFNHKIKVLDLGAKVVTDSCGTGDYHIGSQPDLRTIKASNKHGVSIHHACRQITPEDLNEFDYLLAMDISNQRNILRLAKTDQKSKVLLMRNFDQSDDKQEVPDPYHGGDRDFQEVYDILDRSIDGFILHLQKEHSL